MTIPTIEYTLLFYPELREAEIITHDSDASLGHLDRKDLALLTNDVRRLLARDLKSRLGQELMAQHVIDGQWIIPEKRTHLFSSGPCVYFATRWDKPTEIKIGSTGKLTSRLNALFSEIGAPLIPLVYCKTNAYRDLEFGLHQHFKDCLLYRREWFYWEPVIEWLQSFLSLPWRPVNERTNPRRPRDGTTSFQRKYYTAHLVSTPHPGEKASRRKRQEIQ